MLHIFLVFTKADAARAAPLHPMLKGAGYRVVQRPEDIPPESVLYARAVDTAVLGSAAVVIVWSAEAARDEWVERAALVAHRLRKPIVVVAFDAAPLPPTLAEARLAQPDQLSLPEVDAPLLAAAELLAHDHIRERRKGIEQARALLASPAQSAHHETVLAWLEHIARHDLTDTMRELARSVLEAHAGKGPSHPEAERFRIGVRCPKGHVTWYDKRRLCGDHTTFKRIVVRRADAELHEIEAPCDEPGCGETTKVRLDCEEYRYP